jgi:hypothetical protein
MLKEVITNSIETPRGYKNPVTGIALRGSLSQFFSAIYLKPLDEDNTQSPRTSKSDGRHWIFYPPDQILLEKMGALVGKNVRNLALRRITKPVY